MTTTATSPSQLSPRDIYLPADSREPSLPIWLISDSAPVAAHTSIKEDEKHWLEQVRFTAAPRKQALVPGPKGSIAGVVLGQGNGYSGDPSGPSELLVGQLAASLPQGNYHLAEEGPASRLAALAWGLGAYRFRRYKSLATTDAPARLRLPASIDGDALIAEVDAIWRGRDLINTPAADMGPAEIEAAVRDLGASYGATVSSIVGDDLLAQGFGMIHAVGRASPAARAPRLVDLTWQKTGGRSDAPRITLVGKGVSFDTGGLDIKPASGMLLMKKDMGGAATAITLARLIMSDGLDVRLRLLIPTVENSISGDAFRPGDILTSRSGRTVEIGNTDAEGRLILADAISLADEEAPHSLFVFATLTGAARVALGPDLPAFFTDNDSLATTLAEIAPNVGDPIWRLPLWPGYDRLLDSEIADMSNVSDGPFAGAVTAALFLKRFSKSAKRFAHFDLYGWRTAARPLGPKGGEPQTARALFALLKSEAGQR